MGMTRRLLVLMSTGLIALALATVDGPGVFHRAGSEYPDQY